MAELDSTRPRYQTIATWFEQLTPQSLELIDTIYSAKASFSDPFNEVEGIARVKAIYAHMFDTLEGPRFTIDRILSHDHEAFMVWTFEFVLRGHTHTIAGCTQFEIDEQGLITVHRDYWDAAKQVYEKVPLLGTVLRYFRRQLSVTTTGSAPK